MLEERAGLRRPAPQPLSQSNLHLHLHQEVQSPASLPTLMAPVVRNTITQSNRQEPLAYHNGLDVSKRREMWISQTHKLGDITTSSPSALSCRQLAPMQPKH